MATYIINRAVGIQDCSHKIKSTFLILCEQSWIPPLLIIMILFVHMLFGAAIGAKVDTAFLAIPLAILGHYFLDIFPHVDYRIPNIRDKKWSKSFFDFVKIFLDILLGLYLITLFSERTLLIFLCGLATLLPDSLTLVSSLFPHKLFLLHNKFHHEKIHYLTKNKETPLFLRIATQAIVILTSLLML